MTPRILSLSICLFVFIGAVPATRLAAQAFTNRTDLLHTERTSGYINPLGASSIDFDGDRLIDIYQHRRLYHNLGAGKFAALATSGRQAEWTTSGGTVLMPPDHVFPQVFT